MSFLKYLLCVTPLVPVVFARPQITVWPRVQEASSFLEEEPGCKLSRVSMRAWITILFPILKQEPCHQFSMEWAMPAQINLSQACPQKCLVLHIRRSTDVCTNSIRIKDIIFWMVSRTCFLKRRKTVKTTFLVFSHPLSDCPKMRRRRVMVCIQNS